MGKPIHKTELVGVAVGVLKGRDFGILGKGGGYIGEGTSVVLELCA